MLMTTCLIRFHKEELAGESINYIHNRAFVEGIVPMQVLDDLGRELLEMRASIYAILARCPRAAETWQMFERGFMCVFIGSSITIRSLIIDPFTAHGIWHRIATS
jgi:hypothetical protein